MVQQKLINITIAIANNLQEKWQQNNITAETLMQLSFSIWDLMLAFFNQVFFFYNEINAHFKLTHTIFALFMQLLSALENFSKYMIDSFYNSDWLYVVAKSLIVVIVDFLKVLYFHIPSTDEMQQKWTQMNDQYELIDTALALFTQSVSVLENVSGYLVRAFNNSDWIFAVAKNIILHIVDFVKDLLNQIPSTKEIQQKWSQMNEQYQVSDTVVALFTQFLSALENIYGYLIRAFNNSDWIFMVARNQMVALTDTTIDILRKLETVLEWLINVFNYILPPEKRGDQIPDWLYLGVYFAILVVLLIVCIRNLGFLISMFIASIVKFMFWCLRVKTMKAPGKPNKMISRGAFEANPKKYFANHRRKR